MEPTPQQIAEAYWAFEKPWKNRVVPNPKADASECGDPQIEKAAKHFLALFETWQKSHPVKKGLAWGIGLPSGEPEIFTLADISPVGEPRSYFLDSEESAARHRAE